MRLQSSLTTVCMPWLHRIEHDTDFMHTQMHECCQPEVMPVKLP